MQQDVDPMVGKKSLDGKLFEPKCNSKYAKLFQKGKTSTLGFSVRVC
jgi:hypothetical protein